MDSDIEIFLYHYVFHVTRVIDGDSLRGYWDMGGKHYKYCDLRIIGVDCAETRTRNLAEKKVGLKATARVQELVDACPDTMLGKRVVIKTHKDVTGKYGRLLAEIYLHDGTLLNQLLLNEKLGVVYGEDKSVLWEG